MAIINAGMISPSCSSVTILNSSLARVILRRVGGSPTEHCEGLEPYCPSSDRPVQGPKVPKYGAQTPEVLVLPALLIGAGFLPCKITVQGLPRAKRDDTETEGRSVLLVIGCG